MIMKSHGEGKQKILQQEFYLQFIDLPGYRVNTGNKAPFLK
jgi:hypothetical protein